MHWSGVASAGFSMVTPWQALGPMWQVYSVASEMDDPESQLSFYRNLIAARNQHAALRVGDLTVLTTTNEAVYSCLRVSENEAVLVLINLSDQPVEGIWVAKDRTGLQEGSYQLVPILGEGYFDTLGVNEQGGLFHFMGSEDIPAYGVIVLQLRDVMP